MIRLSNITKIYPPDVKALYKVNLHIKPGEFVSIVGQSGTGKTTLVKILICEEKPSQGKIVVGGWDITNIGPQVLKIVGLENKMHRYPLEVSGGEQQRAVIARALVHRPKILLADEPTGNLDSINADEIIEILQKINKFGTTVVLVTHNREVVNKLRKRVITIENGLIVGDQAVGKYIL